MPKNQLLKSDLSETSVEKELPEVPSPTQELAQGIIPGYGYMQNALRQAGQPIQQGILDLVTDKGSIPSTLTNAFPVPGGGAVAGMTKAEFSSGVLSALRKAGVVKAGESLPEAWQSVISRLPSEAVSHLAEVMAIDSKKGARALAAIVNPKDADRWWMMGLGSDADAGSAAHEVAHYYYKVLPQGVKDRFSSAVGEVSHKPEYVPLRRHMINNYSGDAVRNGEEFAANAYAMMLKKDPEFKKLSPQVQKDIQSMHDQAMKWQGKMKPAAEVAGEEEKTNVKRLVPVLKQEAVASELYRPQAKLISDWGGRSQDVRYLSKKEMGGRAVGRNSQLGTIDLLEGMPKKEAEKVLAHEDAHQVFDMVAARVPLERFSELVRQPVPRKYFELVDKKGVDRRDRVAEAFAYWVDDLPIFQREAVLKDILEKVPKK